MKPLAIDLFCGLGGWTSGLMAEGYRTVGFDIERHQYAMPCLQDGDGNKINVESSGADGFGNANGSWFQRDKQGRTRQDKFRSAIASQSVQVTNYPAQLVLQDVLTIHGSQFRNASLIVASPPCQQYSWLAMPWSRSKSDNSQAAKALRRKWETEGPDNCLFEACFRIQREACEAAGRYIPMVVENVRGAQEWVGAVFHGLDAWMAATREERWRMGRSRWNYGSFYLWGDVPALMPLRVSGVKFSRTNGGWFGDYKTREGRGLSQISGNSSKSPARKAASAMIAKIPFELSSHIARVYRPKEAAAA